MLQSARIGAAAAVFVGGATALGPVPTSGGAYEVQETTLGRLDGTITAIVASPDERHVAWVVKRASSSMMMVDDRSSPRYDFVSAPVFSPNGEHVA